MRDSLGSCRFVPVRALASGLPIPRARRRRDRCAARLSLAASCLLLSACDGPRSALDPAGVGAERIAALAWWLFGAAALVWILVMGLALYTRSTRRPRHPERTAQLLIVVGGTVFPTVVLAALLAYALWLMPQLDPPVPAGTLVVEVVGEQWWWRVRYPSGGDPVELANEVHLPVGTPSELELASADVIHSFWVPALAGKMDMIPGRKTRLVMQPTRIGQFQGACAEFCGAAHAQMGLLAVVEPRARFERWLAHQRLPAAPPATPLARRGQEVFTANGCGACHSIRGTEAAGSIGPDLTHVGSRRQLAAGVLRNEPDALRRWVSHPRALKPGVLMPAFGLLPQADLVALGAYLRGLQ